MISDAVNHGLPAYYAYCTDRQQRRQDRVAALALAARNAAPDPIAREKAGQAARRAGESAFDLHEPQLSYEDGRLRHERNRAGIRSRDNAQQPLPGRVGNPAGR
jgi:hypothetical protein